jgi:hypothetical protein
LKFSGHFLGVGAEVSVVVLKEEGGIIHNAELGKSNFFSLAPVWLVVLIIHLRFLKSYLNLSVHFFIHSFIFCFIYSK